MNFSDKIYKIFTKFFPSIDFKFANHVNQIVLNIKLVDFCKITL